jgi:hypothetical protein
MRVQRKESRRRTWQRRRSFIVYRWRRLAVRTERVATTGVVARPPEQPLAGRVRRGGAPLSRLVELLAARENLAEGILADDGPGVDCVDNGGALGAARVPRISAHRKYENPQCTYICRVQSCGWKTPDIVLASYSIISLRENLKNSSRARDKFRLVENKN